VLLYCCNFVKDDDEGDLKKKLKKSFFKLDTSTFSLIIPQVRVCVCVCMCVCARACQGRNKGLKVIQYAGIKIPSGMFS